MATWKMWRSQGPGNMARARACTASLRTTYTQKYVQGLRFGEEDSRATASNEIQVKRNRKKDRKWSLRSCVGIQPGKPVSLSEPGDEHYYKTRLK